MKPEQARALVTETFQQTFDKGRFLHFVRELLNGFDESKAAPMAVPDAFAPHIRSCARLGTYESPEGELTDVLIVHTTEPWKLDRTRTALRDFVAHKLKRGDSYKEAGLVAFVAPDARLWRFSFVRMEYESRRDPKTGKIAVEERLTPARRFSYIVGKDESSHSAQSRFLDLLQDTETKPPLAKIEEAFSVETVTKEFFAKYRALFEEIETELRKLVSKDKTIAAEFKEKYVSTVDFAKKLMGQIVFLNFLQKKGWLGVAKGQGWGTGPHDFLRRLARGDYGPYDNFFNDVLEPLFYDTLATDRGHEAWCNRFKCRIPFLNGGLFEPLADYDWRRTDVTLPNRLFTNTERFDQLITGTGVLDVFDRYNFTVNEAEPLEKEVAIDPEMLGKVFESLIEDNRRKGLGAFYTPREIVHFMCQESLINYLDNGLNRPAKASAGQPIVVPRKDVEVWIQQSDQFAHYAAAITAGTKGDHYPKPPESIRKFAREIDDLLRDITVCDPAIGSGAFPVGMMTEVVRTRVALTPYFNDVAERTPYYFKRHAIQSCLYGADIDAGAVEIAKLRLWLSLVVDEVDVQQIKPLPNLDYKIVVGNSLLGVEKNLFNVDLFKRLEELKPRYFDATDRKQKEAFKHEIDDLIHELTNGKEAFDFEIYFSEVFHSKKGFDVVIANPPYVGEKGHKDIFQETKNGPLGNFYQGKMDLFYFFFHLAINLGKASSNIAFITTNYYPSATGAKNLRGDLRNRTKIKALINFNELKIFESALGQHNMITVLEKAPEENAVAYTSITQRQGIASSETLQAILKGNDPETHYYSVAQKDLYDGEEYYIRLSGTQTSGNPLNTILSKIVTQSVPITDLYDVRVGLRTGIDKISQKHLEIEPGVKFGDSVFVLNKSEVSKFKRLEIENIIKPLFKNSNIRKWCCSNRTDNYVIYTSSNTNIDLYPNIKKHLSKYRSLITQIRKKDGEVWYSIVRPREERIFTENKIVCPQRSLKNTFAYNSNLFYASSDVYYIINRENENRFSLKYVLALLNSSLYYLWLYYRGKRKGETLELYQQPLSEIPIKRISTDEQKPFIKLVDRILAAKQRDAEADVSALEREIDELVYALYGLTKEEEVLVQAAAK